MIQDTNTQKLLDTLEGVAKVIERRASWYTLDKRDWEDITFPNSARYYVFFPREIANTIPLDGLCKSKAMIAQSWYRERMSEKDDVVSIFEFYGAWLNLKGTIFRILLKKEFVTTCVEREDLKDNPQLRAEIEKLEVVFFTSTDMAERFVSETCPLLSTCIERWKLLNELREHSQEACFGRK